MMRTRNESIMDTHLVEVAVPQAMTKDFPTAKYQGKYFSIIFNLQILYKCSYHKSYITFHWTLGNLRSTLNVQLPGVDLSFNFLLLNSGCLIGYDYERLRSFMKFLDAPYMAHDIY